MVHWTTPQLQRLLLPVSESGVHREARDPVCAAHRSVAHERSRYLDQRGVIGEFTRGDRVQGVRRALGRGERVAIALGLEFFIVEIQHAPGFARVPLEKVGKHAQKEASAHAIFKPTARSSSHRPSGRLACRQAHGLSQSRPA
jgi:hypothetical protein